MSANPKTRRRGAACLAAAGAVVLSVLASLSFTLALLIVRDRVRDRRRDTVRELGAMFFPGGDATTPAFDYVRAKYGLWAAVSAAPDCADRAAGAATLAAAAMPYMLLCGAGSTLLFVPTDLLRSGGQSILADSLFWTMAVPGGDLAAAAAVCCAAFLGGYLMTAQVLLRAVQNYELSHFTFLRCATHLVFGVITAVMSFHILRSMPLGGAAIPEPLFLAAAFTGGYAPDFGLVNLGRRLRVRFVKNVDLDALSASSTQPPEMLDGIDYAIRYRLDQAGISDVQNLAVANPLLLYVATPYTLYQLFDWVLQAQLCVAVGGRAFRELRRLHVRTSLDLERAVLDPAAPPALIAAVGAILFPDTGPELRLAADPGTIRHVARVALDDLHVHRVRHLWMRIFAQVADGDPRRWLYGSEAAPAAPPAVETRSTEQEGRA